MMLISKALNYCLTLSENERMNEPPTTCSNDAYFDLSASICSESNCFIWTV